MQNNERLRGRKPDTVPSSRRVDTPPGQYSKPTRTRVSLILATLVLATAACSRLILPENPTAVAAPTALVATPISPVATEVVPTEVSVDSVRVTQQLLEARGIKFATGHEQIYEGSVFEMFPESSVYMNGEGDIVIVDSKTNMELVGQRIETMYGVINLLVSPRLLEKTMELRMGLQPNWGGYPDLLNGIADLDEYARVFFTLAQLAVKDINVNSIDLASYRPTNNTRELFLFYTAMGSQGQVEASVDTGGAELGRERPINPQFLTGRTASLDGRGNVIIMRSAAIYPYFGLGTGIPEIGIKDLGDPDESIDFLIKSDILGAALSAMIGETILAQELPYMNEAGTMAELSQHRLAALFSHPQIRAVIISGPNIYDHETFSSSSLALDPLWVKFNNNETLTDAEIASINEVLLLQENLWREIWSAMGAGMTIVDLDSIGE